MCLARGAVAILEAGIERGSLLIYWFAITSSDPLFRLFKDSRPPDPFCISNKVLLVSLRELTIFMP